MSFAETSIDWLHWFDRWERMQDCYVPQRRQRFDLMLAFPELPSQGPVHILDLGCGPGSLAFHAFKQCPRARLLAVDLDAVLLHIGQQVAERAGHQVQFLQADLRDDGWWDAYREHLDLVISATALHWLDPARLCEAYQHVFEVLKPGGWFMNSDHVASDDPHLQERYRQLLAAEQKAALAASGADDWNGFWNNLGGELGRPELLDLASNAEYWQGTDDGQPREFHLRELRACGFQYVSVYWQYLGEAVIGAQKHIQ